jgi:hypothetical protein
VRDELTPIAEQAAMLERLRGEFAHTIEVLDSNHPIESYTCAVHAFHLVGDAVYREIADSGLGRTYAGTDFVEFAIKERWLIECGNEKATKGDFVIYLLEGRFGHVGRMQGDQRVLSKWGTGYLCEHSPWEVPCSYGLEVRFYRRQSAEECFDIFVEYTKTRGYQWQ